MECWTGSHALFETQDGETLLSEILYLQTTHGAETVSCLDLLGLCFYVFTAALIYSLKLCRMAAWFHA